MLGIRIITVGKQREPHLQEAFATYQKRLTPLAKLEVIELPAVKLSDSPSQKEITQALEREASEITKHTKGSVIALCIEGKSYTSEEFSALLTQTLPMEQAYVSFVIGSSYGLAPCIKKGARVRLSLSSMTLPHALAHVVLLEQLYRGFLIARGSMYHK